MADGAGSCGQASTCVPRNLHRLPVFFPPQAFEDRNPAQSAGRERPASDARLSATSTRLVYFVLIGRGRHKTKTPREEGSGLPVALRWTMSWRLRDGGHRHKHGRDRWMAQQITRAESENTRATLAFQEPRDCLRDRFMRRYRSARCACRPTGQDSVARVEERFGCGSDLVGGRGAVGRRKSEVSIVPRPAAMRAALAENKYPFFRFEPNGITPRSKLPVIAKRFEKLRFHDGC